MVFPTCHGQGPGIPENFLTQLVACFWGANVGGQHVTYFTSGGELKERATCEAEFQSQYKAAVYNDEVSARCLGRTDFFDMDMPLLVKVMTMFFYTALDPRNAPHAVKRFAANTAHEPFPLDSVLTVNTIAAMRVYTAFILTGKATGVRRWWCVPAVQQDMDRVYTATVADVAANKATFALVETKMRTALAWSLAIGRTATDPDPGSSASATGEVEDCDFPEA